MKKSISLILLMFLFISGAIAQFSFAQYLYVPNGTAGIGLSNLQSQSVGIATSNPNGKLGIFNDARHKPIGLFIDHNINSNSMSNTTHRGAFIGVKSNRNSDYLRGMDIEVTHLGGGYSYARGLEVSSDMEYTTQGWNYGMHSIAYGKSDSYGGYFYATNTNSGVAYGIYASSYTNGSYRYAGYFAGNIRVTGNVISASDRKLKRDIRPTSSVLDRVMDLNVYDYEFKTDKYQHMNLPEGKQTGFIAQEVSKVWPELVQEAVQPAADPEMVEQGLMPEGDEVTYQGMDYAKLVPMLTKALQEMNQKMEALENEIAQLKEANEAQEEAPAPSQLFQNIPNPALGSTQIPYFLEATTKDAQIVILDITSGDLIRSIELEGTGRQTVEVDLSNLKSGTFSYILQVNGKAVDSKYMVKQ